MFMNSRVLMATTTGRLAWAEIAVDRVRLVLVLSILLLIGQNGVGLN